MTAPTATFDELHDNERHCCDPLIYVPSECPPCARCNHGDCAHPDGGPCQAVGCECTRHLLDGDCPRCDGDGHIEDPDTGRTYTCREHGCSGGRVA
jgi:hypothetical protein